MNTMNFSLGILKPDCLERNLEEQVLKNIECEGFKIVVQRKAFFNLETIAVVYLNSIGKKHYEAMSKFLMSGPVIAYIVYSKEGDTINRFNGLVGYKDPTSAKPNTIRGQFGQSIRHNITHSSTDETCFIREARIFFTEDCLKDLGIL